MTTPQEPQIAEKERAKTKSKNAISSRRRLAKRFLTVGRSVLLIGILITIGLLSALAGLKIAMHRVDVATPEVLGKTTEEAVSVLEAAKLDYEVISSRYDNETEAGRIVSQLPAPGGMIKAGRKVRVVLSLGIRKQPVPRLLGNSLRTARAKLMQTEYRLGSVSELSLTGGEEDRVILQYPPPGSEESGGATIDLLVRKPQPARFRMPDLVGMRLGQVLRLAEENGFKLGKIQYRRVSGKRRGTVLRQYPESGFVLTSQDTINVEVVG